MVSAILCLVMVIGIVIVSAGAINNNHKCTKEEYLYFRNNGELPNDPHRYIFKYWA